MIHGLKFALVCLLLSTCSPEVCVADAFEYWRPAMNVKHTSVLGAVNGVSDSCLVELTGDVNVDGTINAADIIYLVNYIFARGLPPKPCAASGDVNCLGSITAADTIYLVNYCFKSGPPPCDVCTLIPEQHSCP